MLSLLNCTTQLSVLVDVVQYVVPKASNAFLHLLHPINPPVRRMCPWSQTKFPFAQSRHKRGNARSGPPFCWPWYPEGEADSPLTAYLCEHLFPPFLPSFSFFLSFFLSFLSVPSPFHPRSPASFHTWTGLSIMGVGSFMSRLKPGTESQFSSQAPTPARADSTVEKDDLTIDDSPVKYLTWRSFILGLCVSMGGFIFGYSTGMVSLQAHIYTLWAIRMLIRRSRSNLGLHHHERFQDALCSVQRCHGRIRL